MKTKPRKMHKFIPGIILSSSFAVCISLGTTDALASSAIWTGGSTSDGNWSDGSNWNAGSSPGSTTIATSADLATFNAPTANGWGSSATDPIVIDQPNQDIGGLVFNGLAGAYFIGSATGDPLLLTSNSSVNELNLSANQTETIDCPLVLEPAGSTSAGSIVFTNTSSTGVLNINGNISGGTTSAGISLKLAGPNSAGNIISGNISDGGAAQSLSLVTSSASNASVWILAGSNTYSGSTSISEGTLVLDNSNALGNTTGVTETKGSSALELEGNISIGNIPLTLYGTDVSLGSLQNLSGSNSYSGVITLAGSGGVKIASDTGTLTLTNTGAITSTTAQLLNLGGSANLVVDSSIGTGITIFQKVGTGIVTVNNTNTYTGATNVSSGTLVIGGSGNLPAGTNVTVSLGATFVVNSQSVISAAGSLNISGNLIVHGGNLSAIYDAAAAGYANGLWNGSGGITSSAAAANTTHLTALGVIQDDDGTGTGTALYTSFEGQPVADSDVLVKYTYYGDANLDGEVDGSDYSRIDSAYLNNLTPGALTQTGWFNGDFNYDGVIDGSDYTLIDNAYNSQEAQITAIDSAPTAQIAEAAAGAAVPEPASMGLFGICIASLLGRRRESVLGGRLK